MGRTPTPRPRSPEDRLPRDGIFITTDQDAVRYELAVRLDPRSWQFNPRQTLSIRRFTDAEGVEQIVLTTRRVR